MIAQWHRLRYLLLDPNLNAWKGRDGDLLVRLLGHPPAPTPQTPTLEERPSVIRQIEGEIAGLRAARAALDLDGIAQVPVRGRDPGAARPLARGRAGPALRGGGRAGLLPGPEGRGDRLNEIARKAEAEAVCDEVASSEPEPAPEPEPAEAPPPPSRHEPVSTSPAGPERVQVGHPVEPDPSIPPIRE